MATKKEREHLVEVRAFSLHELTTICLDATRFKLTEHVNPSVKEFAMTFWAESAFQVIHAAHQASGRIGLQLFLPG